MHRHDGDLAWGIRIGLLGVLAFMTWPVWGVIVSAYHHWTPAVAASALVPLAFTLFVVFLALDGPARTGSGLARLEHATHIDNLLHHGRPHRHA